jgi:hypothetical protein
LPINKKEKMSDQSNSDENHDDRDERIISNREESNGENNEQSVTTVEIAQWHEFLDASSNKFYYHNYATGETSWEKPTSTSSSKIIQIVPYQQPPQSDYSTSYGQSSDSLSNTYASLSSAVTSVLQPSMLTTPGQGDYAATAYFNQSSGRFGGTGNNYWEEVSSLVLLVFSLFLLTVLPCYLFFFPYDLTRKEFLQIVRLVKCHAFLV